MTGLLLVAGLIGAAWGWWRWVWPNTRRGMLRREIAGEGWATTWDVHRDLRPSGAASRLGKTVVGPRVPTGVRVGMEETVAIIGGPRRGKSLLLADLIRRHRRRYGAVVASTTRFDLLTKTVGARLRGQPSAWLFAPEGADGATGWLIERMVRAGWVRWLRWSPVAGCEDPLVASERASALVGATDSGSSDDTTWLESATTVIRCYLRAAAIANLGMDRVYEWVVNGARDPEAYEILLTADPGWAAELASELLSASEKGAASVLRAARLATQFMANPRIAETCCPADTDSTLDVRELVENRGALYMVTEHRKFGSATPLTSAFTSHLFDSAVRIAKENEDGKLSDPLLLALDEVFATARVELPKWTSFAGGHNIHMAIAFQNPSQLREVWGAEGASAILDNSSTKVIFGGIEHREDVERFAGRCGKRWGKDPQGSQVREPVLDGYQLSNLPKFRAVLISGACPRPSLLATARWRVTLPNLPETALPLLPVPQRAVTAHVEQVALPSAERQAIPMPSGVPTALPPVVKHVETK